ncbi:phytanoyl-CoA dioxygenase family protein [Leptospira andrefontaineae]|uniref:Phytanoyl-CoA dioxygenase family protein n=1 Tax=Leptospira andrefontaineae TaxID=2484976 RepID=A0A4V3JFD7_9LEPT|nr:phytanoyl-CoA dioxygenase family protein [Leptospira andrefontaineae]TGK36644.1 phytanoyl-CoA dioxygenase family protein [Leptospira andrefontaineae]
MSYSVVPVRPLTEDEISRYDSDGVIMVKGAIDANWLHLIEAGLEKARLEMSLLGKFMSRKTQGYQMDTFLWKRVDEIRDAIYYGPFAHWAQQLMGAKEVRFFYDQMFVKEPGTDAPTPWHQDLSFWPIRGEQITSFWIPLDPVTRESSGLMYVKGSHKWTQRFKAISPDYVAAIIDEKMDDIPDINANPEKYDLLDWVMNPGDILMFHPLTLHGSYGNNHRTRRRRALALRWTGDDVIWEPSSKRMPIFYQHTSIVGKGLSGAAFPRILPEPIALERNIRRFTETPSKMQLLVSGINNITAAVRLKFKLRPPQLRQTWK